MCRRYVCVAVVAFVCSPIVISIRGNHSSPLPKPPELHARNHKLFLTLHAVADSKGRDAFAFNGQPVAPILRVSPGDTIQILGGHPKAAIEGHLKTGHQESPGH